MAVLYFSTTASGAGNGTTWDDRAALFDGSNNWTSYITEFDFTGASLECRIGPGNYTCGQLLQNSTFSVQPPTIASQIYFIAADTNGNRMSPPDPDWTAVRPTWTIAAMPVINVSVNVSLASVSSNWHLIKITAANRTGGAVLSSGGSSLNWCVLENSSSGTSVAGLSTVFLSNCVIKMTSTSFSYGLDLSSARATNVRLEGNPAATDGDMRGIIHAGTNIQSDRVCVTGFNGGGIVSTSTNTAHNIHLSKSIIVGNGGNGVTGHSTASQTNLTRIIASMITGNTGIGVDASAENIAIQNCRLRHNSSDFANFGNHITDLDILTAAVGGDVNSWNASEYVNYAAGDFRIKRGSAIWGKGYGIEDESGRVIISG